MRERMRWDSVHSPTSLVDMVHAGWVQRLLRAEDWRGFPGPGDDRTGGQTRIEPQAKRIFEKLADLDISYVHEPANSIPGAQDVRPVDEVLSLRQATCLDMCVTYCCAALDAGIYPLILTLTRTSRKKELRHAIVLVPLERSWSTNCDVVIETGFSREPLIVDEDDFKNVVVDSPDDPSGTWLAIDVQQVSAPPGGATGKWNTALSKGADYVRNWEWDLCVDIGGLRSRRADDADLPTVMGVEGVLAPAYIPLPSNYTFLQLIRARYGVVSFHDRHELRNLRRWAMTPTVVVSEENASKNNAGAGRRPDVAVAVVTGVGGSGKTRLAAQLCHDLSSIGWYTGFLPTTTDITVGELSVLAELTTELLVVVDYAEEARRGQLATVFRALRDRRSPTRIVLTARGTDVWWDEFREELEQDGIDLSNALIISRLGEDRFQNDPVLFDRIYRKAVRSFAERMNHPSPRNIVVPDNLGATALDVVLRAWLAVYDESANSVKKLLTRDDLYDKVLTIEFTQWRKAPALAEVSRVHMGRAAATLSLLAPSQDEDEVDEVLSRLPEWASEHLRRSRFAELLVHTFLRVDGENSVILRPDPVAEYLILKIFGKKPGLLGQVLPVNLLEVSDFEDEDSDTDEITVQQHVRYRQAQNACMTITRAASLDPKKAYRLAKRTLRLRSHMWSNALDVAITQGGPFAPVLEEFIASGADLPLAEIEDAIPLGHGALRSAALALTRRLIDSTEQSPEQRALWVNTLAIRLSEAGEREEALKTAREATDLYRDLAQMSPTTHNPDLAGSLNNLANRLSEAGEREEALKTAREATGLYRDLAQMSPTTHNPDLAGSLNNLATFLSEVGERDEALEVAREAVQMRRDLVDKSPETYKPDLAMSLNNLAAFLSEVGEREEALKTAREATGLYRDLVEKSPATYKPGLAMSLTTLANHLSEAGERDEALEVAREAVHLRRDLVKVSPAAYTPDLAMSLSTLANRLLEVGERDEALEVAREATDMYRDLVKVSPAAYTPDLAMSLSNLANRLLEVGERDEALEVAREAVHLRRDLVKVSPVHTQNLAGSLNNLANCLLEVGERDEALEVAREATDMYRDLVEKSPASYTSGLAMSLTTLANCLLEVGERDEALKAAREAVRLRQDSVQVSPTVYTPNLAESLITLANCLLEAGERDEALEIARKATELYRGLAKESPALYTPDLAVSLTTLANRLSEVGERDEALEVAREATDMYRDLVEESSASYTPGLAMSLTTLANRLSEVGERDEALIVIRESTDLFRGLVEVSPATYTPDLAGSLNNLAAFLSEVGEQEEALKTAREAVSLRQDLVQVSPVTYTPDLAGSLNNLAAFLSEVGEQEEALNTAREAVSLRQDLVQVSPVTYTPDLAGSLNNLAIRLLKVGEREEALKTARKATELYRGLVEVSPVTYTPDLAGSLSNLANCLAEVGRQDEALQVFIKGSDRFSPATRAHFLLTRAFWCNDNQEDDLVAAAREADDVDTPALLGPTRRVIVQAIADSGQNLEGLPSWATVEIGAEMRERLEKWINCDDDSERANILEEIWNSPSSSECSALSAVAELYVDVPPIGDLAGLVNRIAEEGVENVVLCIRRRHYAQVIVDDWYSAHANGQGCRSLCKHMVSRSSGENKDYPEWKRELDDPRMRVEVLQLLEMSFSEETANELRSILELADLSDPESAYEVHDSVEEAENALEDLLRVGNWRAMIAALRVRSDLGGLRYGSIAAVLGAAASDDLDRTCKLLDSMHQEIDEVDRQLVESLLKKALLAGDCPEGFEYLHEWFR